LIGVKIIYVSRGGRYYLTSLNGAEATRISVMPPTPLSSGIAGVQ